MPKHLGLNFQMQLLYLKPDTDNTKLLNNIKNMSDVRKVQFIDEAMVKIDKNDVSVYVMEDYSKKETDTVYRG